MKKFWTTFCLIATLQVPVACATTSTCPPDADGQQEEACLEARRSFWAVIADLLAAVGERAEEELDEAGEDDESEND